MSATRVDAAVYADTERRLATLLDTRRDVLLVQGEAILLLEAAARGVGGPGVRVLNLVSGPYGQEIGEWLAVGGAQVHTLTGAFDRALDPAAVADALAAATFDVVSVVHAEAATGVVNPLAEVAALAHRAGAVVLVDAVASVGAEPLDIDASDLDLVMIGPQKALGGPAGVCALIAGTRGWEQIEHNPAAPRHSTLSLLDLKQRWIDAGRRRLPGYAYEHEMRALIVALDALEGDIGLGRLIERHRHARDAVRSAAVTLGLRAWVADDPDAAAVVTLVRPPEGVTVEALLRAADAGALLTPAPGPLAGSALRVNHTGRAARSEPVLDAVRGLADGLARLGLDVDGPGALAVARERLADRP